MFFLVTNDDGYYAPGIVALAEALGACGEVAVIAPDRNRSGASNSLTLDRPLRAMRAQNGFIFVNGTPTDCVHLAITGLLPKLPDMVISGINMGYNLGDDVLYSGTVAAAMEGRFLGLPALAVSLGATEPKHYETATRIVGQLIRQMWAQPLPVDTLLNVNIPDLPYAELAGLVATRLGKRHKSQPAIRAEDPRGRPVYWVGPAGDESDAGPGTDFHAVRTGYASVTPLQVDLTRYEALTTVTQWLGGVTLER